MALGQNHEMHERRKGRNYAVLGLLIAFAVLIFAVTMVKMGNGHMMEGFDHTFRASALPVTETTE
jgi:hypothetical protein